MNPSNKINTEQNPNQKAPKSKPTAASKTSKNEEAQMIDELNSSKIGEKEFYEKIKPWIEGASENFGRIILECMKLILQKNFLAYQLFKMLMGSKVKTKLKSMTGDTEKNFYANFWGIIEQQKGNVKAEGLKLLGYLTSEHLQNMSQVNKQSQIDCLTQLKKLCNIKIYATNVNVIRLSYNCIGNILTNSNYKFIDENHEIFYHVSELLRDFNSLQKLEDPNNIKALAAALRVLGCLYLDLKVFPANVNDFLISQLLRYLYFGTSFFPLPNITFPSQSGTSSDSQMATSSSEISDMDDSVERKKEDEATAKIRNYSAVCLANIFRQNTKMIPQYFSTLLPCKILRKEVIKFIDSRKEPLLLSDMEFPEKRNKRAYHLLEFRNDFNEPTLLNLLLFEENSKVKLSVCKTISAILDGYYGDKLLLTIDGEKLEKTKIDPYKSISHQIYQIFKNVTLAVTVSILVETDETLINHLLRLASTMLGHSSYEKVGHLTIQVFVENILSKMLPQYMNHTIYLSCISCFSSLASGNIRYKTFDRLAFRQDFNIVDILVHAIKDSLNMVIVNKDAKPTKPEKVSEGTILLESIIALSKFAKHYFDQIIEHSELVVSFLEKTQTLDKKYLNVTFKLFEETLKHLNNDKDEDQLDGEVEVAKKEEVPLNLSETIQSQSQVQQFHKLLAGFLQKIFNSNSDNTEHILDILYYLQDRDWEIYYKEVRDKFIEAFPALNAQNSLKQSFLRLLGKLCTFSSFMKIEKFPRLVYEVVCQNANEKNNNVVIKSSWVLANLSANLSSFEMFSVEENQELFLLSLGYCNSPKEKLISNGFRALGYYISNNSDEILCKTILTKNAKADDIKKILGEVYKKPFSKYSVKVCWNVCVSLSNIFKSFKPNFMQLIFSEDILYNIAEILTTKNNFKTQIHCIETLTLAYSKFPQSPCFAALMKTLIKIYFAPDEVDFDVSELRYLPHLRADISGMLLKLLKDFDYEKNSKFIIDVLVAIPHGLSKILYDALEKSYKEHKDKLVEEKWKGDEENKSPTITQKDTLMNFDEVIPKGMTPHSKLTIPLDKLHEEELKDFKKCLEELQGISQKIVGLIDDADELSVPFSVYDGLKQLTDLDLNSKEKTVSIDLDHI